MTEIPVDNQTQTQAQVQAQAQAPAPRYHAVLLDCDGTLLDTLRDLAETGNAVCKLNGWPTHSIDEFRHLVGNGQRVLVRRLTPANLQADKGILQMAYEQFCDIYARHGLDHTAPYPGIIDALERMNKAEVRLGVLTNKNDDAARSLIHRFFGDLLPVIQGRTDAMPAKPDPAMTHALMAKLGAEPATTLMVGDSDVDILCGINASIDSCGVLWGFRDRAELEGTGATHIAQTPDQLRDLVLGVQYGIQ